MEKFNNTTLFTGYLKQLLHDFNLPKLRIYTAEQAKYFEENGVERYDVLETITQNLNGTYPEHLRYIPYLKDGLIQEYIDGEWKTVGTRATLKNKAAKNYSYGEALLNYTKNLVIRNNVYDSYTHEYLGDYLRFHRDYLGLNLMPLYNCFSNHTCKNLYINSKFLIQAEHYEQVGLDNLQTLESYIGKYLKNEDNTYTEVTSSNINSMIIHAGETSAFEFVKTRTGEFVFDSKDANYKIFMLPVKLFQTYTIAIDSELPIEICCGIYGKYQDKREKFAEIPGLTYKKLSHCQFTKPLLYTEVLNLNQLALSSSVVELAQNESNLKLFLKVPVSNDSTIVVLEGDYTHWNDYIFKPNQQLMLSIWEYGHAAPTDQMQPISGSYYLDVNNNLLYKYVNNKWNNLGLIWQKVSIGNYDQYVDRNGHGAPKPSLVAPLGAYYLDIDTHILYQRGQDNWFPTDIIWQQVSLNNLKFKQKLNKPELIVDNNYYSFGGIDGDVRPLKEENYFKYYLQNNQVKHTNAIAYFNTSIKKLFINNPNTWTRNTNYAVINLDNINENKDIILKTPLQLLRSNTTVQYPFADRLIEYLIENCITNREDEVVDNILRVQKLLNMNYNINSYTAKFPGTWDNRINKIIYSYINTHDTTNTFEVNHDILGYVDKDAEKYYSHTDVHEKINALTKKPYKKYETTSISTVELSEEEK